MRKTFVEFLSPGTFMSESTVREISSRNVAEAIAMAADIVERHGAKPYGFRFFDRIRGENDLDSCIVKVSGMYYLGGKVETLAEVEARNDPKEAILRSNMRCNGIKRIIVNNNSWRFTGEFKDGDTLLDHSS